MPLTDVVFDHIAVAVPDVPAAVAAWRDLGAVPCAGGVLPAFRSEQVSLGNGGKVELIGPSSTSEPSFIDGFLDRFGPGTPHHVTLKVPSFGDAISSLADDGFDVVDVNQAYAHWHEAFLRPSVVGGIIVQIAWTDHTDAEYAASVGRPPPEAPDPTAPSLGSLRIGHPDPPSARKVWTALGATLEGDDDAVQIIWPGSPMHIELVRHDAARRPAPIGLVLGGIDARRERTDTAPTLLPA